MVASSTDGMEEKVVKQQLFWNANNMGVSTDGMEQEDEGQGPERSKVESQEEEGSRYRKQLSV